MLWKENFCLTWNMTNKKAKNKDCTWIVEVMQTTAAKTDSFLDLFENRLQTKIISSCRFICNRILCKVWIFAYLSEFISKLNKIEILQSNLNESIRKFISMRMTFDRIHIERSTILIEKSVFYCYRVCSSLRHTINDSQINIYALCVSWQRIFENSKIFHLYALQSHLKFFISDVTILSYIKWETRTMPGWVNEAELRVNRLYLLS